jgi:Tfp pilus assembly protein FimT
MIEMLIVIAILAILGTLSIASTLAAKNSTELSKAQEEVTFLLGQARMLAISEEVSTRVIFATDGTYRMERQDRDTLAWSTAQSGTGSSRLPGTVTLTGNTFPSQIPQFTPRGTLLVGGTITLRSVNGQTVQLVGNVASGRFPLGTGGTR